MWSNTVPVRDCDSETFHFLDVCSSGFAFYPTFILAESGDSLLLAEQIAPEDRRLALSAELDQGPQLCAQRVAAGTGRTTPELWI